MLIFIPVKEDEHTLLVRTLKTWFSTFMPFTYKISEDVDGRTIIETDLVPEAINNTKITIWNYVQTKFSFGERFSTSDFTLTGISLGDRQVRRILNDFVKNNKLKRRGSTRNTEYSRLSSDE